MGRTSRAAPVLADLRERYGRGPLRVVKWLIQSFALVGVYLLLVALVLDRPVAPPGLVASPVRSCRSSL